MVSSFFFCQPSPQGDGFVFFVHGFDKSPVMGFRLFGAQNFQESAFPVHGKESLPLGFEVAALSVNGLLPAFGSYVQGFQVKLTPLKFLAIPISRLRRCQFAQDEFPPLLRVGQCVQAALQQPMGPGQFLAGLLFPQETDLEDGFQGETKPGRRTHALRISSNS
jgi:hypothetical protein